MVRPELVARLPRFSPTLETIPELTEEPVAYQWGNLVRNLFLRQDELWDMPLAEIVWWMALFEDS